MGDGRYEKIKTLSSYLNGSEEKCNFPEKETQENEAIYLSWASVAPRPPFCSLSA